MDFDMPFPGNLTVVFYYFALPLALLLTSVLYYKFRLTKQRESINKIRAPTPQDPKKLRLNATVSKPTQWYQSLFFQLQHLEDHPTVLEPARDELLAMFSRGISVALEQPQGSILNIDHYDAKRLSSFIHDQDEKVSSEWISYLQRRKQGQGPGLFATVEAAKKWLVQKAPIKFMDGAWLGHIHKITTPFALRKVTKDAWQVLSEEFGDGDISKHHVYLYRQLLEDIGCPLPDGQSIDFIQPHHWDRVDNRDAWEAAVGQLLISLFPNEFLPEILGFNMHYELLTLTTLQAAHELKALGINPYYFLLHISIDNSDSGHTAMAMKTVTTYLDMVRETEGEAAMDKAWKRVQVGYILSQTMGDSPSQEPEGSSSVVATNLNILMDPLTTRMIDIFKAKSLVAHQIHYHSRVHIGGQTLTEWLAPSQWNHSHTPQHLKLLTTLRKAKQWIRAGQSSKSNLLVELSWDGRMFGAFTNDEVAALAAWVDSLGSDNNAWVYWSFVHGEALGSKEAVAELQDPARHHPVIMPRDADNANTCNVDMDFEELDDLETDFWMEQKPLPPPSSGRLSDLIPLWFAHIGLLENTINTPSITATPLHASIMRLLRAQAGFAIETPVVAGMDEVKRASCPSLVDIGLELISRAEWTTSPLHHEPSSLQDVFLLARHHGQGDESAKLAHDMLCWAAQPNANLGLLLGLALAFLRLKDAVAMAPTMLGEDNSVVLMDIVARERSSLEECVLELRRVDPVQHRHLIRGYKLATRALEECVEERD